MSMKKLLGMFLVVCLLMGVSASALAYEAGTYTAQSEGNNGPVMVEVTFSSDKIESVNVTAHVETPGLSDPAIEQIPAAIVEKQSLAVDAVTGATNTSKAIMAAVEDCAKQAGADVEALKASSGDANAPLTPGIYEATADGFNGKVRVFVTVDENAILDVTVASCTDQPEQISRTAIEKVPAQIVATQSTKVDAASGATFTSNGIRAAVENCLKQAGNASRFAVEPAEKQLVQGEDEHVDLLVIGGGTAGCMAALYAQNRNLDGEDTGLKVMLIEKQGYLGGSGTQSGGYIGAAMPLDDDTNLNNTEMMSAYIESMQVGEARVNDALLESVARISGPTILAMQKLGMPMLTADSTLPAESYDSLIGWSLLSHGYDDPTSDGWRQAGDEIGQWYERRLAQTNVDVRYYTTGDDLIVENGKVIGAVAHDEEKIYNIYAKKVIIATGGIVNNAEMLYTYYPQLEGNVIYVNGGSTGDGVKMIQKNFDVNFQVGKLMDGYFGPDARIGIDSDLRYSLYGGAASTLIVNQEGERFFNDGAGFDTVGMCNALYEQPGNCAYIIVDSNHPAVTALEASSEQHIITRADSIESLAEQLGIDPVMLAETVKTYTQARNGEIEDAFGVPAENMISLEGPSYYAIPMCAPLTATYSGLEVGDHCEVIDAQGNVIENLYAAGETAYGMASLANAMFSGAIAGEHAMESILAQ